MPVEPWSFTTTVGGDLARRRRGWPESEPVERRKALIATSVPLSVAVPRDTDIVASPAPSAANVSSCRVPLSAVTVISIVAPGVASASATSIPASAIGWWT